MTLSTSAAAGQALPRSKNALRAAAEASTWAHDDIAKALTSKNVAWRIAASACGLAVMGWVMAAFLSTRPIPAPVVITVDRTNGDAQVAGALDANSVPQLAVADQHWAERFVRACETYRFSMLQGDYDQCARMSSPKVFAPIQAQYVGESAKQNTIGEREDDTVATVVVRLSPSSVPGRHGEAIVTFDKTIHLQDGTPDKVTRYVGTCEYEYRPEAMKKPIDRLENPFGFICKDYRKDAELASPVGASAPTTPKRIGG